MNSGINSGNGFSRVSQFDTGFYQAMIDTLSTGAFLLEDKRFLLVNDAFCELTDSLLPAELIGQLFERFIFPKRNTAAFEEQLDNGSITRINTPEINNKLSNEAHEYQLVVTSQKGKCTPIELSSQHFKSADGRTFQVATLRQRKMEHALNQALREPDNNLAQLFAHIPDIFLQIDASGIIRNSSNYSNQALGYLKNETQNKPLAHIFMSANEHAETLAKIMQKRGELVEIETSFRRKDGTPLLAALAAYAEYDASQKFKGIALIGRKDVNLDVQLLSPNNSVRDPLTHLINHLTFHEHLIKSVRRARRHHTQMWVLQLNLQNYIEIKNRFGNNVSNSCLVHFSQRLQSFFRDTDIIARVAEDQFAVLLDDYTNQLALNSLITRLQEIMNKKSSIAQYPYGFQFNIGSANYPEHGITSSELLEHAESMMFRYQLNMQNQGN
ncbi:MAG: diguanylate cyclase (GGDEF)-like protein/PAS domain S-box-containing protein [Polaribacter sp.]|jgi:diguanylate cyclase (GGDEF)-like protein/PAS domain S-box-containing protein